jgi:nicotinate-nucleotide pyrophosphorylase (carboxylating)
MLIDKRIEQLITLVLHEDIGSGDVTSKAVVDSGLRGTALIRAKEKGVLAGMEVAEKVFYKVDSSLRFTAFLKDGDRIRPGDKIAYIKGNVRSILKGERTALNFLQQLSGVATYTASFVDKAKGAQVKILDTRKTVPNLRSLQKEAVKSGGGENHRRGLYDMILIKENHIRAAGSISEAIKGAKSYSSKKSRGKRLKIEVETKTLKEAEQAVRLGVDMIMLDNMPLNQIKKAVKIIRSHDKKVKIEVSGKVELNEVRRIAATGVDFISAGALTHSAKALDFSLKVVTLN